MSFTPSENPITHPERESYTELRPFRFWCQKVLPLVYDNSLSYYELLCKVVDYLNKTMEDVDHMNTDMDTLYSNFQDFQEGTIRIYNELVAYVNAYFDNLDVQEEINNKLDEMVTSGELVTILQPSIASEVASWLAEHITPTTPAVDDTLTVSGAAADAKVTGDKLIASMNDKGTYGGNLNELHTMGVYHLSATATNGATADPLNESVLVFYGLAYTGRYSLQVQIATDHSIFYRMVDSSTNVPLFNWLNIEEIPLTENTIIYDKFFAEENIYNTFAAARNTLLNNDGTTSANSSYTTTDYMPVLPTYFFKFFGFWNNQLVARTPTCYCYYDKNKSFILYGTTSITIPDNAKYARVSFPTVWESVSDTNHHLCITLTKNNTLAPFYRHFKFYQLKDIYTEYNSLDGSMFIKDETLIPYNPTHTVFEKVDNNRLLKITDNIGSAADNGCVFGYINRSDFENKKFIVCIESDKETTITGVYIGSRFSTWGGNRITLASNMPVHVGRNYIITDITTDMIDAMEAGGNYKSLSIMLKNENTETTTMYVGYSILDKTHFSYSEYASNIVGIPREKIIKYTDKLYTKIWNACGDSVTAQGLYTQDVKNKTYVTVRNYGVSSSTIAKNDTYLTNQSLVERICGLNGNTPIGNADIWTIFAGLNDALYNSTVGSLATSGSYDITTVYGALQTICEYILNLGNTNIWLCTPTKTSYDNDVTGTTVAQVRQAIVDVGHYYSIPIIDLWTESKICAYNLTAHNATTSDGVHPNALGADYIGDVIAARFASLYIV